MLRYALAAALLSGATIVSATPGSAQVVDCLSTGRLALLSISRQQGGGDQGHMLSLRVTVRTLQSTPQSYVINDTGPARYAATGREATLAARAQNAEWIASFNGGYRITDAQARGFVRLTCR